MTIFFLLVLSVFYYVMACMLYADYVVLFAKFKEIWNGERKEPKKMLSFSDLKEFCRQKKEGYMYIPRRFGYVGYLVSLGLVCFVYAIGMALG